MNDTKPPLETLKDFVQRATHWTEGGATRHDAIKALDELTDDIDWIEKGIVEWREEAMRMRAAINKATNGPTAVIPPGWKLVPEQTTSEMVRAFDECRRNDCEYVDTYWEAMLAATPEIPR